MSPHVSRHNVAAKQRKPVVLPSTAKSKPQIACFWEVRRSVRPKSPWKPSSHARCHRLRPSGKSIGEPFCARLEAPRARIPLSAFPRCLGRGKEEELELEAGPFFNSVFSCLLFLANHTCLPRDRAEYKACARNEWDINRPRVKSQASVSFGLYPFVGTWDCEKA